MAENPQKRDFVTWTIQNIPRKVKQFVRKYYITWLIDLANKLFGETFNSVNPWLRLHKEGKNE